MRRRHRRRGGAAVIALGGIVLAGVAVFAWVVFIFAHVLVLVLTVAAVAAAYRLGQRHRPPVRLIKAARQPAVPPDPPAPAGPDPHLADQVKLLEQLAARPLASIIESYKLRQQKYGGRP